MIEVKNLSVGYSSEVVLSDLNFILKKGEMVALVGQNGAGKSTLIQTLIGVLEPLYGDIEIKVENFREIGFSAQTQMIDWYTSVRDNVMQGPLLSGQRISQVKMNTNMALELLGISDLANKATDHLSGGQQQRMQIAREIARKPKLYILDEPTTGLDVESSEKLLAYLREKTEEGATVLISSHDLTLVERYVEKLLFIDEHQQKFFGSMKSFFESVDTSDNVMIKFTSKESLEIIGNTIIKKFSITEFEISEDTLIIKNPVDLGVLMKNLENHMSEVISIGRSQPTLRDIYMSMKGVDK